MAIGKEIKDIFEKEVINGDASNKAHFAGETTSEIATMLLGGELLEGENAERVTVISECTVPRVGNAPGAEKIVWPPNDGGILGTEKNIVLEKGYQFDRYWLNTGSYVAPVGVPYEMRSLAPGTELKPYKIFEVVKPVRCEGSVIAPWFNLQV